MLFCQERRGLLCYNEIAHIRHPQAVQRSSGQISRWPRKTVCAATFCYFDLNFLSFGFSIVELRNARATADVVRRRPALTWTILTSAIYGLTARLRLRTASTPQRSSKISNGELPSKSTELPFLWLFVYCSFIIKYTYYIFFVVSCSLVV